MKGHIGVIRQGYCIAARSRYARHLQSALPNSTLSSRTSKLHSTAYTAFMFPSPSSSTEHHIDRATSSTSRAGNPPPPPLPIRKRSPAGRTNGSPQLRVSLKEHPKASTHLEGEKTALPSSIPSRSNFGVEGSKGKGKEQQVISSQQMSSVYANKATSTASDSNISTSKGKEAEPRKTLLERIKGLWATIRYLFRFYYEGTKQIWKDRSIVKEMRLKIVEREAKIGESVRWIENAIIEQHESDLRKLPLFLAILLILEEVLPLLVIYAPSLLPSTCVLPSQSTKMRSGEERLRGLAIQELAKNDAVCRTVDQLVSSQSASTSKKEERAEEGLSILNSDVLKQVAPLFALSAYGPKSMIISRIQRHLQSLESDDALLLKAFKSRASSSQWKEICDSNWLLKACSRRGLRAFEADQKTMEQNLIAYLYLVSCGTRSFNQRALLPLALYDGTMQDLIRLQVENKEEHAKGIRKRTMEVVNEVKEAEKKKEETK